MRRPDNDARDQDKSKSGPTDRGHLRTIAKSVLDDQARRSESTRAEYARVIRRLAGDHWHDYATRHHLRTVGAVRAAWRVWAGTQIIEALRESEQGVTPAERAAARNRAASYAAQLIEQRRYHRPTEKIRQSRKSKRASLCNLPQNWRERLVADMPQKHRTRCMIIAVTGARPEEMHRPVKLLALPSGTLQVTFQGAKTSELTLGGQEWRRMTLRGGLASELWALVERHGGSVRLSPTVGLGLQKSITATAARLGYPEISAYSLRHAFAADLKKANLDDDLISLALGHVSRKSKSSYGTARQGRCGRVVLLSAEAKHPLRGEVRSPSDLYISNGLKGTPEPVDP